MNIKFEWDPRKADANQSKHGVSFEEALTVFADRLARIFDDIRYSDRERREIIIGHSSKGRLLVVSFVERDGVRIISARKATKVERHDYEEGTRS
jgi:uncharacterized protein